MNVAQSMLSGSLLGRNLRCNFLRDLPSLNHLRRGRPVQAPLPGGDLVLLGVSPELLFHLLFDQSVAVALPLGQLDDPPTNRFR